MDLPIPQINKKHIAIGVVTAALSYYITNSFFSIPGMPQIIFILFFVGANLVPHMVKKRKTLLGLLCLFTLIQAVAIFVFNNPLIKGATLPMIVLFACLIVGIQALVIGGLEIDYARRSGDQEAYDDGNISFTTGLIAFGYMFVNLIVLIIIFSVIPVYGVQYNGLIT